MEGKTSKASSVTKDGPWISLQNTEVKKFERELALKKEKSDEKFPEEYYLLSGCSAEAIESWYAQS